MSNRSDRNASPVKGGSTREREVPTEEQGEEEEGLEMWCDVLRGMKGYKPLSEGEGWEFLDSECSAETEQTSSCHCTWGPTL